VNVITVTATIKYSAEAKGAWRTIEVGAEADVALDEDWHTAQASLYDQLGQQLKTFWSKGASKAHAEADDWEELGGNHKETLTPVPSHYCQAHQCQYKRYEKDGKVWWSHRQGNGWCKER
jgi:hypothetical protein